MKASVISTRLTTRSCCSIVSNDSTVTIVLSMKEDAERKLRELALVNIGVYLSEMFSETLIGSRADRHIDRSQFECFELRFLALTYVPEYILQEYGSLLVGE